MPHFSHTVDIERSPLDVWRAIGTPERWFEGYLETRSRSEGYPGPDTRDDHLYRTRRNEEVGARAGVRDRRNRDQRRCLRCVARR